MTADDFRKRIDTDGYVILPDVLDPAFVERAKSELVQAIAADTGRYGPRAQPHRGCRGR